MTHTLTDRSVGLEYWLRHFGMPEENIEKCVTQIAQGYGACRYLEGVQHGAEAVNELAEQEHPSLPSNLDEAANNYSVDIRLGYPRVMDETDRFIYNAFKSGAEWMAGQGETKRGVATQDHFIQFADDTYIDLDPTMKLIPAFKIKDAEEIFVQIRKK